MARASAFQAECREFESRFPLHWELKYIFHKLLHYYLKTVKIVFKLPKIYLILLINKFCSRGSGAEHFLGKEEVGGSNPLVSSMRPEQNIF